MRDRPTLTVALILVAFIGLVLWVSDAFNPWELAAIVTAIAVMVLFMFGAAVVAGDADRRLEAEADRRSREEWFVPPDWEFPEDTSDVRHGGLGR